MFGINDDIIDIINSMGGRINNDDLFTSIIIT